MKVVRLFLFMTSLRIKYFLILCLILLSGSLSYSQSEIDSLEHVISVSKEDDNIVHISKLVRLLLQKGQYDKALDYGQNGLNISIKKRKLTNQADFYNEIGLCFQNKSDWEKSLKNYLKAAEIYDSLKNKSGASAVNGNIGYVYRDMRNYKKAMEYLSASLNARKELGDKEQIAVAEVGMGSIYYDLNDYEKSIQYFQSALQYYQIENNKSQIATLQNNIGSIYNELEKFPEAIENYKKALAIYSEFKDSSSIVMCLANIGNAYNVSKDYKQGIEYLLKAHVIAERIHAKQLMVYIYSYLIEGYQAIGDFKKVVEYQNELIALKDEVYDAETNENIAEMQTKFDTEKKEKENEILKQQNDLQNLSLNRQKIINYSITFGLLLVLGLAFFIFKGYKQKQKANIQLEEKNLLIQQKNKIVEEKNKDITDSIRYAKRLQTAILKPENTLTNYFDDGFILFKPKDIVSGDFYWFEKFGNLSMIAAADCTGHGVPGAFMSIIGCNLLSQAVNEYAITQPAAILNSINKGLTKVLQQKGDADSFVTDGMDIALCSFNSDKMVVEYAGAFNPLWIIRNGIALEFVPDKFPVGAFVDSELRMFNCHEIPVQKGDMVYVFSDGYADQFGGPIGKKFKYKPMQKILLENYMKSGEEQRLALNQAFEEWIGNLDQIDDVLVIGIRI